MQQDSKHNSSRSLGEEREKSSMGAKGGGRSGICGEFSRFHSFDEFRPVN